MILTLDVIEKYYILPMEDEYLGAILDGHCIKGIEYKSKCSIELCTRILTRYLGTCGWVKYNIMKITGPTESAIDICNRMIEIRFPKYIMRKEYDSNAPTHMYISEMTPDNNHVFISQRSGANLDQYQGLTLKSVYNAKTRYPGKVRNNIVPWHVWTPHFKGIFYPNHESTSKVFSHVYPSVLSHQKSIKVMGSRNNQNKLMNKMPSGVMKPELGALNKSRTLSGMSDRGVASENITDLLSSTAHQKLYADKGRIPSENMMQTDNEYQSHKFEPNPDEQLSGEVNLGKENQPDESSDVSFTIDLNISTKHKDLTEHYYFPKS